MRKNLTSSEIGAAWVKQSQPFAQCSSMSFEGPKFFSYGTVIGQIVKDKNGKRIFLINRSAYSSTSSMHLGRMRDAIPKTARVLYVTGCDRWSSGTFFDHKRILSAFEDAAKMLRDEAKTARVGRAKRLSSFAESELRQARRYASIFGLKYTK